MHAQTQLGPVRSFSTHAGPAAHGAVVVVNPFNSAARSPRCRTCGATARPGVVQCLACASLVDQTRSYVDLAAFVVGDTTVAMAPAVEPHPCAGVDERWCAMLECVEGAARSPAELVWDSLQGEDQTAVWSDSPGSQFEPTRVDVAWEHETASVECVECVDVAWQHETARHAAVPLRVTPAAAQVDEAPIFTTSLMPEARAAVLLRLAPNGYAGTGTPVDAAVVPRGQMLDVGRGCAGPWAGDVYLDDLHARLLTDVHGVRIIDPGSRGGVWLRQSGPAWLRDGDWFRVGEQFFCYDAPTVAEPYGRLHLIDRELRFGPGIEIHGVTVMGRDASDVVLMHDPFVSAQHCRILPRDDGAVLEDLDSSNGTWVRLRNGDLIPFGAVVAIGRSLYRVEPAE